ncbi:hypothetical protein BDP27DRAFT_1366473 [Rhodocollybia butyracea]|uniref:Fungal-type protein kinase domain-containing protein n=1 Tax=Rhodocollybia butyracea TaxID=206335 RepID=A0A9P5PHA7_9AGAR|nr:hypothetical protein BDP27DRAFT_1366473 [Rhodocollybia butyracea]
MDSGTKRFGSVVMTTRLSPAFTHLESQTSLLFVWRVWEDGPSNPVMRQGQALLFGGETLYLLMKSRILLLKAVKQLTLHSFLAIVVSHCSQATLYPHTPFDVFEDENIQLFHDDHSAVIFSRPVNIVGNIEHLLHLMDTMVFTRRGISSLINVTHDNVPSSSALRAPHLNLFPGVSLSLLNGTFCFTLQHEIIGQGSCVIRKGKVSIALAAVAKGSVCIGKLTRQARLSELALIDNACKLASSRHSEWVLHHLPTISLSADLPLTPRQEGYGQHILRITVMTKLLPITELTNPADLKIVFRDIFRCYRWLVEEAKILHRNVNVANITFQYGSDGSVYGVLNDFDHAIRTDVLRPPSSHRTGTAPYMAIDILCTSPPPIHLYRHDLESLYYVLVCSVCPADHPSILSWFRLGGHDMAAIKRTFFTKKALTPRAGFEVFLKWIIAIHRAFFLGLHEQDDVAQGFEGILSSLSSGSIMVQ